VVVLPLTKVRKGIASHIPIAHAESGLDYDSFVICEQVRCVSRERLVRRIGQAPQDVLARTGMVVRVLLEL